jgi:TrbB protein
MKIKDTVIVTGDELYTHFAATGTQHAATMTNLHHGAKVYLDGLSLMLAGSISFGAAPLVLETFASDHTARHAIDTVQQALVRRQRVSNLTQVIKGLAKYVMAPIGLVLLGLAMNVAVHNSGNTLQSGPYAGSALPNNLAPLPIPMTQSPNTSAASPNQKLQLAAPASQIAAALKSGVDAGKFTVKLGSAKGEPIYVFEDPLCVHCQELAPELNKLAKTHPVYVFPVSPIGGDDSRTVAATALCAGDREKAWALAMSGASTIGIKKPTTPTASCLEAVRANDLIFATIGMRYTPSLFNARGVLLQADQGASAEAIEKWLPNEG